MNQIKMFSYGTLQRAGALYSLINRAVKDVEPAVLEGYAIYKHPQGNYPEAFPLKGHSIKGELLTVDAEHPRFVETMMMELNAGYKMQIEEVVTPNGFLIRAVAFTAKTQPSGYLIEGGNWLESEKFRLIGRIQAGFYFCRVMAWKLV